MRKIATLLAVLGVLFAFNGSALAGDVFVQGYFRNNGTYVQPHYRSQADGNVWNNWSTKGNVNPYTGEVGTYDPY